MGVVVVVTETRPLHLDVGAILVLGLPASFVGTVLKFNFFFFLPNLATTPSGTPYGLR